MCWRYILQYACNPEHMFVLGTIYKQCNPVFQGRACINEPEAKNCPEEIIITRNLNCPECPGPMQTTYSVVLEYLEKIYGAKDKEDGKPPVGPDGEVDEEVDRSWSNIDNGERVEETADIHARQFLCLHCHNYGHCNNDCPLNPNRVVGAERTLRSWDASEHLRVDAEAIAGIPERTILKVKGKLKSFAQRDAERSWI